MNRYLLALASVVALSGCAVFKPYVEPGLVPERPTTPEGFFVRPAEEYAATGEAEWGLALSGGGIRSATVVMGALKALYDRGVLDQVDVISTVSGGGYAAYWLYSREYRDRSLSEQGFGATSFENSSFLQGACEVATTNNFVNKVKVVGRWAVGLHPTRSYRGALLRTYGQAAYDVPRSYDRTPRRTKADSTGLVSDSLKLEFHDLRDMVKRSEVPNWIVNARVYRPRAEEGWLDGMYELTPFHRGTARDGFRPWIDTTSYEVLDGVSASGAAVAFALNRTLPERVADQARPIRLSDGGHGENLGALALIRRRVPNIIIVDAEHDPTLKLTAYRNLKKRLGEWGIMFHVPTLSSIPEGRGTRLRPERGVHFGTITSPGYNANVYYLKLSLPLSMDTVLREDPERKERAEADRERVRAALEDSTRLPNSNAWDCRNVARLGINLREVGIFEIQKFVPQWALGKKEVPKSWNHFPHVPTETLSINLDRTFAQMAVGYLLGAELAQEVKSGPPPGPMR